MPVSVDLTFYNEDSGMCVDITIIDDVSLERSESFYLTLTRTEGLNERIQFTADKAKITINENNGIIVRLYSVSNLC